MNEPKEKVGRSRCGRKPLGRVTLTTRPMAETADIIRARALAERKTPGEIMDEMFAPLPTIQDVQAIYREIAIAPTPEPGLGPEPVIGSQPDADLDTLTCQTGTETVSTVTVNGDVTALVLPVESSASNDRGNL